MAQSRPFLPTALVVEDDPIQREMIALLLEPEYDVIQCEDAETAELALKNRHAVLLITDITLVGVMNGVELVERARKLDPAIRVIVMSGRKPPGTLPDDVTFFAKPFYPVELIREVNAGRRH